jgi:hypothetical protein
MTKDDLKGFKISDQVKTKVDRPTKKEVVAPAAPSAGFPALEALVDAEPDMGGFHARHASLVEMSKSGTTKDKAAARKAATAYEKTKDVIGVLMDTKKKLGGG